MFFPFVISLDVIRFPGRDKIMLIFMTGTGALWYKISGYSKPKLVTVQ
jgi:hypothetical protein